MATQNDFDHVPFATYLNRPMFKSAFKCQQELRKMQKERLFRFFNKKIEEKGFEN